MATPRLGSLVAAYFDPDPASPFAGHSFDTYGTNTPDAISADDLLAVAMLDIRLRPPAVRAILGEQAGEFTKWLAAVDPAIDLWDADTATLTAAERLWELSTALPGIRNAIASKILARKRPRLVPIADSVIVHALRPPQHRFWATLRACLQSPDLRHEIEQLRPADSPDISLLRLLDVAIWMRFSGSTSAKAVRALHGVQ